jgi:hypothetical protein
MQIGVLCGKISWQMSGWLVVSRRLPPALLWGLADQRYASVPVDPSHPKHRVARKTCYTLGVRSRQSAGLELPSVGIATRRIGQERPGTDGPGPAV